MNSTLPSTGRTPSSFRRFHGRGTLSCWQVIVAMSAIIWLSPAVQATTPAPEVVVAQQSNDFAVDLFKRVASRPGNTFLSPWSVRNALSMTAAGARGQTLAEMAKTLRLAPKAEQHPGMAALNGQLTGRKGVTVTMANRLWVQMGFILQPSFLDTVSKNYGSGAAYVDFSNVQSEVARINGWVAKHTGGHIQNLLSPSDISAQSALVLTNATYFKAFWTHPFDPALSSKELFKVRPDYNVAAATMTQRFEPAQDGSLPAVRYDKRKGYETLDLPYGSGGMSMRILLPSAAAGDLNTFIKTLSANDFARPPRQISAPLIVRMPKFKRSKQESLGPALAALGMSTAFTRRADFGGVAIGPLWLSNVIHQAFINVDETGTEAAAATAMGAEAGAAPRVAVMLIDRPFIYAIADNATGAILYMGRMDDPTKP